MTTDADLFRLLRAAMRFVDRHAERKHGPGVVEVPLLPHEMKEFRSALEPFRERYKELEALGRKRVEEIVGASLVSGDEATIRELIYNALDAPDTNGVRS